MRTGAERPARSNAQVADQDLAAPDRPVRPVARAVEDRADRRALDAVLGEARGEVRVVVLDADQLQAVALERVGGRRVVGVEVVGDDLGRDREQPLEVLDPLPVGEQRRVVLEVADVVADPGAAPAGEAERGLELRAAGQHRPRRSDRQRRRSPARSRASGAA